MEHHSGDVCDSVKLVHNAEIPSQIDDDKPVPLDCGRKTPVRAKCKGVCRDETDVVSEADESERGGVNGPVGSRLVAEVQLAEFDSELGIVVENKVKNGIL